MRLNRDPENKFRNGRMWLYLSKNYYGKSINFEWYFFRRSLGCHVNLFGGDGNDALQLYLACGLFSVWLTFEGLLPKQWAPDWKPRMSSEREIGVRFHGGTIWASLWDAPMGSWERGQPWWWSFTLPVVDWLLGKPVYSERDLQVVTNAKLHMCEHESYTAVVRLTEATWKRPRWFVKRIKRGHVEVDGGVPHPGKGTMSYNCGDDATYSVTTPAETVQEALAKFRDSVNYCRTNYPL